MTDWNKTPSLKRCFSIAVIHWSIKDKWWWCFVGNADLGSGVEAITKGTQARTNSPQLRRLTRMGRGQLDSETRSEHPVFGVVGRKVCTRTKVGRAYKTRVPATGPTETPVGEHALLLHVCCMRAVLGWMYVASHCPETSTTTPRCSL